MAEHLNGKRTSRPSIGLGGSDIAAALGISKYGTPRQMFARKRAALMGLPQAERADSEAMLWGRLLEPLVVGHYAKATGREIEIEPDILYCPSWPIAFASLDAWVIDPERGRGVLEIKTCSAAKEDDWAAGPPDYYLPQVQHYLIVTGASWASVAVLIGGQKFRYFDLDRDEAACAAQLAAEKEFWRRVIENDPPAATDRDVPSIFDFKRSATR